MISSAMMPGSGKLARSSRFSHIMDYGLCGNEIECPTNAAMIANTINHNIMITGVMHATTISQAANTLNVILKTDENGTLTSVIATFVPGNTGGDVVKTLLLGDGAGSSVPYFSIGRYSSIVRQSLIESVLQGVAGSTLLLANICGICVSEYGSS